MPRRPLPPLDLDEIRCLRRPHYSTREVAAVLGLSISAVNRRIAARRMPGAVDLGGSAGHLIPRRTLRELLAAHERAAAISASSAAITSAR
jgi:hypothetical protein